ncbi:MAG: hypothetical protein J7M25_01125 [Deltaproteobacteria bacterium]|nr:hypothetical protein [Deltaproteobacteria bacterium]
MYSKIVYVLTTILLLASCGDKGNEGPAGAGGPSSLIEIQDEDPGATCEAGGIRISWGVDIDDDGVLSENEVAGEKFVCNGSAADGQDGHNSLAEVSEEPAGTNCAQGGQRLDTGIDENDDGELQPDEINATSYVCDGVGTDGNTSLIVQSEEPAGENCLVGGIKIESGIDENDNGTLDENEVTTTSYVCEGLTTLTQVSTEPPGENCAAGGTRIETGLDNGDGGATAGDGILQAGEVDDTEFSCHAEDIRRAMLMNAADEDFFAFPSKEGFMSSGAWAIIETVQVPEYSQGGWHFFRGRAWEDLDGDVAISVNIATDPPRIHAWLQKGGWVNVVWQDPYGSIVRAGRWLTICMQRAGDDDPVELWVDGIKMNETPLSGQIDDTANPHSLFFGGQDVDPSRNVGDLYSEADVVMVRQTWLQRTLNPAEMIDYRFGAQFTDNAVFFDARIQESQAVYNFHDSVASVDATIGNTPEVIYASGD